MRDPSKIHFPGQGADETVLMAIGRHPMALVKKVFVFFVGAVVPVAIFFVAEKYTTWLDDKTGFLYLVVVLLASLFYLYILLFIYHVWVDYYLDIWLVTNERVISIEQKGLFHREVSELRLDKIQDVSSEVKGFLPTIFKYGSLQVQTASEADKFYYTEVPNPEILTRQILELHEQYLMKHPGVASVPAEQKPAGEQEKKDETKTI